MHFSKTKPSINLTKLSKFYTYLYGKLASFYKKIFFRLNPRRGWVGAPLPACYAQGKKALTRVFYPSTTQGNHCPHTPAQRARWRRAQTARLDRLYNINTTSELYQLHYCSAQSLSVLFLFCKTSSSFKEKSYFNKNRYNTTTNTATVWYMSTPTGDQRHEATINDLWLSFVTLFFATS